VLSYGEFIKFIQNAIEWENVLYFNYPYFWESAKNWPFKLFLNHYDSFHQTFLRSGAARVVLTIRPGFEENFATFMQSGVFGILGKTTPYVSIAKEIQNFAMTNYPGIPPANPDVEARPLLYPEQRKAWADMQKLILLLEAYVKVKGHYPSTTDGLAVLDPKLDPTLTLTSVPQKDPWGHAYAYACPGKSGEYDLVCYGADGVAGGEGLDADIASYADGSVVATWYEYTPTSALDIAIDAKLVDMA
jgi:type II secretion system protein G